jgi:glycosyltransferase involved in cell wall biosynthesis
VRVLIVNYSSRKIAGAEDYLENVIPTLNRRGHELGFAYDVDGPMNCQRILLPLGTPQWGATALNRSQTLTAMKSWKPDVIYAHGALSPPFEEGFLGIAPAVYFAHNYYGTCISGLKAFKSPVVSPCNRQFGKACLVHYLPRRCGGKNPVTMLRLYLQESRRLNIIRRYRAIITHSSHMREEYVRHGISANQVYAFIDGAGAGDELVRIKAPPQGRSLRGDHPWNILFVGRMEQLKGGATLIDALPSVAAQLQRPIRAIFAGDGTEKTNWEKQARQITSQHSAVQFQFTGWMDKSGLGRLYDEADLLAVPSLWPEPFGRIGPEAGRHSVPAVAFAVGGIRDWLRDGLNGFLAKADPPTAASFADAIVRCLEDGARYRQLRVAAFELADRFNIERHVSVLENIFESVRLPSRSNANNREAAQRTVRTVGR